MIFVVQNVKQISIERMEVLQTGKLVQNPGNPVNNLLRAVLDLPHIKAPNPGDFEAWMHLPSQNRQPYNRRGPPVRLAEHDVNKLLRSRNGSDVFKIVSSSTHDADFYFCWNLTNSEHSPYDQIIKGLIVRSLVTL